MPDLSKLPLLRKRRVNPSFFLLILVSFLPLRAQEGVLFSFEPEEKYRVIEKFNLSQYRNGRYQGHIYRENRGIYDASPSGGGLYKISGRVYELEETTRDGFKLAAALRNESDTVFTVSSRGVFLVPGTSWPRLRSFPSFPDKPVFPGDKWEAGMDMVVSSPDGTLKAVLPLFCEYRFKGSEMWEGRPVYVIEAQYAARYRQGRSPAADTFLKNLSGKHLVSLLIDQESREFILMKDLMEEEYLFRDGSTLKEKGFLLTFYKGIELLDRTGLSREVESVLEDSLKDTYDQRGEDWKDHVSLVEKEEGLALNLKNLHFLPDQAVLLPEDIPLLDTLAEVLKSIPGRTFLVKGHTADVGSMESQIDLSQLRARRITDEMTARGIEADRFLYTGVGGLDPLGDNATDEGRKMNRRVEILILED